MICLFLSCMERDYNIIILARVMQIIEGVSLHSQTVSCHGPVPVCSRQDDLYTPQQYSRNIQMLQHHAKV